MTESPIVPTPTSTELDHDAPGAQRPARKPRGISRRAWRRVAWCAIAWAAGVTAWHAMSFTATALANKKIATTVAAPAARSILKQLGCPVTPPADPARRREECSVEYLEEIVMFSVDAAYRRGLGLREVLAVINVESAYRRHAISDKLALGLKQIDPLTWVDILKRLGIIRTAWDLFDPKRSIESGAYVLAHYLEISGGNMNRALCMYNAGYTMRCADYPQRLAESARGTEV